MCIRDSESIVLHVVDSQKLSFLINVVHHFQLLIALATAFEGVVEDRAVEPTEVIQQIKGLGLLFVDLCLQVVVVVEDCVVDYNVFWVVGSVDGSSGHELHRYVLGS